MSALPIDGIWEELSVSRGGEEEEQLKEVRTRGDHDPTPQREDEGDDGGPVVGAELAEHHSAGICAEANTGCGNRECYGDDGDGNPCARFVGVRQLRWRCFRHLGDVQLILWLGMRCGWRCESSCRRELSAGIWHHDIQGCVRCCPAQRSPRTSSIGLSGDEGGLRDRSSLTGGPEEREEWVGRGRGKGVIVSSLVIRFRFSSGISRSSPSRRERVRGRTLRDPRTHKAEILRARIPGRLEMAHDGALIGLSRRTMVQLVYLGHIHCTWGSTVALRTLVGSFRLPS